MAHHPIHTARRMHGFSLVEMLISVLLIAVGLLGLAKVQAMAAATTKSSNSRSTAAYLATDLAGRIRASAAYWRTSAPTTAYTLVSNGTRTAQTTSNCVLTAPMTSTATCAQQAMALHDLDRWSTSLNTMLPMATATVQCAAIVAATPRRCDVTLSWVEAEMAMNENAETAAAAAATTAVRTQYTLPVWP